MSSNIALERFCTSFAAKDAAAVAQIFEKTGLFDFPFAGQRLVGRSEIEHGVRRMCENLRSVSIELSKSRERGNLTIAEGMMKAVRTSSPEERSYPLSLVVEQGANGTARIAAYFDTFRQRPWLDGAVFDAG